MINIKNTEFERYPDNYQYRNHVCLEFARHVGKQSDTTVLFLEARPGIGATCLAAEYLETIDEPGILITVNAASRVGYSTPFILDQVSRQALEILEEPQGAAKSDPNIGDWHRLLSKLHRRMRNKNQRSMWSLMAYIKFRRTTNVMSAKSSEIFCQ